MPQAGNIAGKGNVQEDRNAQDKWSCSKSSIYVTLTDGNFLYAQLDSRIDFSTHT